MLDDLNQIIFIQTTPPNENFSFSRECNKTGRCCDVELVTHCFVHNTKNTTIQEQFNEIGEFHKAEKDDKIEI